MSDRVIRGVCHHDCPDSCVWEVTVEQRDGTPVATRLRGADHPFTRGELCPKVNRLLDRVYHPDRVLTPLVRTGAKGAGEFAPVSWDEALGRVADELRSRSERYGPATVLPYFSAGTQGMLQMAAMSERFFNRLGASRTTGSLCGAVAKSGVIATQGTGTGLDPEDLRHSRFIILWGTNTLLTNRHLWPFIEEARTAGAQVVCVDPIRTATAAACDWHVQLLPGTDTALALGLLNVIIERDLVDHDYVGRHTVGFSELAERAAEYPPELVAKVCGIDVATIERLAIAYATTRPAAIRVLIGMEHREHGAMAFRAVACLPAIVGAWRDKGGGLCRSVGSIFGELLPDSVLERADLANGSRRGIVVGEVGAALTDPSLEPPITALVVGNANPAVIAPAQGRFLAGLGREDLFTVVLDHFVTDTARYADVVLPATTQLEHLDLMAAWGHLYLTLNLPAIPPLGSALPNTEIFRRLAAAMGFDDPAFQDSDEDMIRSVLAAAPDHPFLEGITYERLVAETSIKLAVPQDWRPFADGGFPTRSGKLELVSSAFAAAGLDPLPSWEPAAEAPHGRSELAERYPLALVTMKSQVRFLNSSYGHLPAHRGGSVPVLELAAEDATARGIADGDRVRVWNDRGAIEVPARRSDRVRPGVVAMPFGHSLDMSGGIGCNILTNDTTTDYGGGTSFHDNLVQVERIAT